MNPAPWRNRLSFGLCTLGRDMSAALVSMYLMFYLTDVLHISQSTTAVLTVVLVAMRIFDALNDPFMGVIIDNTRSRFGKFKPWIALGAVLWGQPRWGSSWTSGSRGWPSWCGSPWSTWCGRWLTPSTTSPSGAYCPPFPRT